MKKHLVHCSLSVLFCIAATAPSNADFVTIAFDDFVPGTVLTDQFSSLGLVVTGFEDGSENAPEVRDQQFVSIPNSGPNYLTNFVNYPSTADADRLDEIHLIFDSGADNISMFLNLADSANQQMLQIDVFDTSNVFQGSQFFAGDGVENVEIFVSGSNIGRLELLQPTDNWWYAIDDLTFNSKPIPEPSSAAILFCTIAVLAGRKRRSTLS